MNDVISIYSALQIAHPVTWHVSSLFRLAARDFPQKLQIAVCKLVILSRDIQEFIKRESHLQLSGCCRVNNMADAGVGNDLIREIFANSDSEAEFEGFDQGDVVHHDNVDQGTFTMHVCT